MGKVYTKEQVKEAILKAADSIEKYGKERYRFMSVVIPHFGCCNDKGCCLGWIAAHLRYSSDYAYNSTTFGYVSEIIGSATGRSFYVDSSFYGDMDIVDNYRGMWRNDYKVAAKVLRDYVEKYF